MHPNEEEYFFLPNGILFIKNYNVAIINYNDIDISIADSSFREDSEMEPKDSKFLGYTWLYVNNNGTPDRRFNNNKKIPIYLYEEIHIESKTGLNFLLMVSNKENAINFKNIYKESLL